MPSTALFIGLGKNIDSSMYCNFFVLDSISIQNFFEVDYFHKNNKRSVLSHCTRAASMSQCTFYAASLAQDQYYTMVYSLFAR